MSRWYIIHAYSGFENKVKDSILSDAKRLGLTQLVESVEVPTEKVTEIRRGKKVTSDRKFFPGYVLAKLAMNDDVYHLVKNTPKVTGFLGPNGKPQAISDAEAARILSTTRGSRRRRAQAEDQGRLRDRRQRSRCSTARSPASTAWSRNWISTAAGSRSASRSSAAPRRSSSNSNRSNGSSRPRSLRETYDQAVLGRRLWA